LRDQLLENLTEPQRDAVTHTEGPLLVIAGPGSGKTRVITHRAAYLAGTVTQPYHILAITFTNKAANEMAERIKSLQIGPGLTCCTFHSFCARLLRIHHDKAGLQPNYSIFDDSDQTAAVKEAIKRIDKSTENFPPGKIRHIISRAKNDMTTAEQFAANAAGWQETVVAEIYNAYDAILAEQNAADFDDLLVKTALLLGENPDIREQLEQQYKYVLVDEYQDTNHAQYLIARGLALDKENLCVTGDPDQSIYGWRGANIQNILQFEEDFPKAKVVRLEQNYRSTPQILEAADAVIANNRSRKEKKLWTHNEEGSQIRVAECEDNHVEADFITSQIKEHVEAGGKYKDVAVFYRVNYLSRNIESSLLEASIPYQVARGVAFYNRKEIKDVIAYLKVTSNPQDKVALLRIINTPTRGIGKTTVDRIVGHAEATGLPLLEVIGNPKDIPGLSRALRYLQSFAQLMGDLKTTAEHGTVQDAIEFIVKHSGLIAMWTHANDEEALENVSELISAAAEYDRQHADGSGSLTDWLQQVSLVSDVDSVDPETGAVTLMTLHAAKGLEFDTVFMAGIEDGLLPHSRSQDSLAELEEERRLCFVGMTRAMKKLTMTYANWRDVRGIIQRTSQSEFLSELPEDKIFRLEVGEEGEIDDYDDEDDENDLLPSPEDFQHWQQGQLVRHPSFGLGRVLWIRPQSKGTYAGIKFTTEGEKTLILEYAKLEIVDPYEIG
jgi:DNA helicase-2/ATP-dependent DNA helicase PcrA